MYDENEEKFNQEDLQEENEEIIQSDDQDESSQEEGRFALAKAEVVRLMKQNLDSDKMIRERVKVEMNKFLGEVLVKVCEQLNNIHTPQ